MKTKEELTALKQEFEVLNRKLHELSEEELAQVVGGASGCVDSLRGAQECDEFVGMTGFERIFERIEEDPEARDSMTHPSYRRP